MTGTPFFTNGAVGAIDTITSFAGDTAVPNVQYLRVHTAGNLVVRTPGASADITIPGNDGEYVPAVPGTIVRSTSTVGSLVIFA